MPVIRIPIPLRKLTDGQANVVVNGDTVRAAFSDLTGRYPQLVEYLYDENGEFKESTYESINALLDKHDVRELQGLDTPLREHDRVMIVRTWPAAISGGRQWNAPVGAPAPQ